MAPICANKSDRKNCMNEIDGFSVLLTFPEPKANRSRKRRQFHNFSLVQGVASLRPIHSYKTACSTSRICSMCFAWEENAITRKWRNQKQLSRQTRATHGKPKGTFKPKDKKIFRFAEIEFWRQLRCIYIYICHPQSAYTEIIMHGTSEQWTCYCTISHWHAILSTVYHCHWSCIIRWT